MSRIKAELLGDLALCFILWVAHDGSKNVLGLDDLFLLLAVPFSTLEVSRLAWNEWTTGLETVGHRHFEIELLQN